MNAERGRASGLASICVCTYNAVASGSGTGTRHPPPPSFCAGYYTSNGAVSRSTPRYYNYALARNCLGLHNNSTAVISKYGVGIGSVTSILDIILGKFPM